MFFLDFQSPETVAFMEVTTASFCNLLKLPFPSSWRLTLHGLRYLWCLCVSDSEGCRQVAWTLSNWRGSNVALLVRLQEPRTSESVTNRKFSRCTRLLSFSMSRSTRTRNKVKGIHRQNDAYWGVISQASFYFLKIRKIEYKYSYRSRLCSR
jgi:hypothetical protein